MAYLASGILSIIRFLNYEYITHQEKWEYPDYQEKVFLIRDFLLIFYSIGFFRSFLIHL